VAYSPASELENSSEEAKEAASAYLEEHRGRFEEAGLGDTGSLPAELPVLALLVGWMQRAFAAREAAINYFAEIEKKPEVDEEGEDETAEE
jgi:hypothetical protein